MISEIREIWARRELLWELVTKEIRLRYRRSALGFLWSLLHPLLMMGVFTLVFSRFPKIMGQLSVPYYIFFLVGYLCWNFFSVALSNSHMSIIANATLVKQVYFPRQVLPLAAIISNFFHILLAFALLIFYLLIFTPYLSHRIIFFPIAIALETLLVLGLGLVVSSLNVFFRDVGQMLEVILTFWFYLTPIFYPLSIFGPEDRLITALLRLNPLTEIVNLYRWCMLDGFAFEPMMIAYPLIVGAILLVIGRLVFSKLSLTFAKEL